MKYPTLFFFFLNIGKDVEKFVVCCSRDWLFKGLDAFQFLRPDLI